MKRLLIAAAGLFALSAGGANAQLSHDETMARLQGADAVGYRVIEEHCPPTACSSARPETLDEAKEWLEGVLAANANGASPGFRNNKQLARRGSAKQEVWLNFDAGGDPTFIVDVFFMDGTTGFIVLNDFNYTPEIRDEIADRIEADYDDFQYRFTQTEPRNGVFTTLNIGDNDRAPGSANIRLFEVGPGSFAFSILFGRADEIDFGNTNKDSAAFTDASFWVLLRDVFPNALGPLSGIPVADPTDPAQLQAATVEAVINQSANTTAHELGHVVGLRHHDSFGAPGDGLPTTGRPAPGDFVPIYPGGTNAAETVLHIMASGASAGLPIQNSSSEDRFFSERSAVKLTINERGRYRDEEYFNRRNASVKVPWLPLRVKNTILEGENAGSRLLGVKQMVIEGTISEENEIDTYRFDANAGEYMNIEMISFTDFVLEDFLFFSELRVYKLNSDGSRTLVVSNFLPAESIDPLILDWEVPETGEYELEVESIEVGFGLDNTGDYFVHMYMVDGPLGRGHIAWGKTKDEAAE